MTFRINPPRKAYKRIRGKEMANEEGAGELSLALEGGALLAEPDNGRSTSYPTWSFPVPSTSTPGKLLGQSPADFLTSLRSRTVPWSLDNRSVGLCTSHDSLVSGKKSASLVVLDHSMSTFREFSFPPGSHEAPGLSFSPPLGIFSCQACKSSASLDGLLSEPMVRVVSTSCSPGTHKVLHSSHVTPALS